MIEEFQELALDIFLFSSNRHIYLDVVWFPWDQNSKVDILNKIAGFDDYSVHDAVREVAKKICGSRLGNRKARVSSVRMRKLANHCQKFGSKWRTRVRIESLMAAKSCMEMYGISTKIQNTTTSSHNIP